MPYRTPLTVTVDLDAIGRQLAVAAGHRRARRGGGRRQGRCLRVGAGAGCRLAASRRLQDLLRRPCLRGAAPARPGAGSDDLRPQRADAAHGSAVPQGQAAAGARLAARDRGLVGGDEPDARPVRAAMRQRHEPSRPHCRDDPGRRPPLAEARRGDGDEPFRVVRPARASRPCRPPDRRLRRDARALAGRAGLARQLERHLLWRAGALRPGPAGLCHLRRQSDARRRQPRCVRSSPSKPR